MNVVVIRLEHVGFSIICPLHEDLDKMPALHIANPDALILIFKSNLIHFNTLLDSFITFILLHVQIHSFLRIIFYPHSLSPSFLSSFWNPFLFGFQLLNVFVIVVLSKRIYRRSLFINCSY